MLRRDDDEDRDEERSCRLVRLLKDHGAACVLIRMDGSVEPVQRPFTSRKKGYIGLARARKLIGCSSVQMVPCTVGVPAGAYELVCDEEGVLDEAPINELASKVLGEQVHGGDLRGHVLLMRAGGLE